MSEFIHVYVSDGLAVDPNDFVATPWHQSLGYELKCDIDSGAFGNVRLVERNNFEFALKSTPSVLSFQERWTSENGRKEELQRAMTECLVMQHLCMLDDRHPNICYPFAVWTEPMAMFPKYDIVCMLLPRVEMDLFTYLDVSGRAKAKVSKKRIPLHIDKDDKAFISYPAAAHVLNQIMSALAYFHTRLGFVHNDVKPENILIDPSTMHCWLTDFGGTLPPSDCGYDRRTATKNFASPERVVGAPFDFKSDTWGVGMISLELFCGRIFVNKWFTSMQWVQLMRQVLTDRSDKSYKTEEVLSDDVINRLCEHFLGQLPEAVQTQFKRFIRQTIRIFPTDRLLVGELALFPVNIEHA